MQNEDFIEIDVECPAEECGLENTTNVRKKIWQLTSSLHCSVIGTCLSRRELRQLRNKKSFAMDAGLSDFEIHRELSALAAVRSPQSRALQKFLDSKYRLAIKRYASCEDEAALRAQWQKDLQQEADIPASYWAVLSHPVTKGALLEEVYGDCHMMSFDLFSPEKKENRQLSDLKTRLATAISAKEKVEQMLEKESSRLTRERRKAKEAQKNLAEKEMLLQRSFQENRDLQKELTVALQDRRSPSVSSPAVSEGFNEQEKKLARQVEELTAELAAYTELLEEAEREMTGVKERLAATEWRILQEHEQAENTADEPLATADECEFCEERLLGNCDGKQLGGRRVLYVGGLHKMIARYRQLVEERGGVFMHHDGGVENSKQQLPRLLNGADVVMCPVDCVSHDACRCLKKMCKKQAKPFVMMRSSGLSSLAKGLGSVVQ